MERQVQLVVSAAPAGYHVRLPEGSPHLERALAHLDYQGERYGWHLFVALNKDRWEAFVRQACRGLLEER